MSQDVFRAALIALTRFSLAAASVADTLGKVSEVAVEALPGAEFAGIAMWDLDRVRTRVFSDPRCPEFDDAQYLHDDGPGVAAFRHGEPVRSDDLRDEERWPAFRAACASAGIRSTLAVPMTVDDRTVGALSFYARSPQAFSAADVEVSGILADSAAATVANAEAYWAGHDLNQELETALRSRAVIDQAKGILMARSRISDVDAFDVLRRASQRENRKLRDVAIEIVERACRPEDRAVDGPIDQAEPVA